MFFLGAVLGFVGGLYLAWYTVPSPPLWVSKIRNTIAEWISKR